MPAIRYKNANNERVPSVTTVLGQWGIKTRPLIHWAYKQGEKGVDLYAKEEAQVGSCVHEMIDCDIKAKKFDSSGYTSKFIEQSTLPFENYKTWKKRVNFNPVETEISLISEKYQFGGTIDCIAVIDEKLCLVDWKTGKDVYEDHIIQCESYRRLWNENFPSHRINGGFHILRTGKEIPMFNHAWYGDFPGAWRVFMILRELHDLSKEIKRLK
jgi:hypothetical protein